MKCESRFDNMKNETISPNNIPSNLYVLKHKDDDVAMVQVNPYSGEIEYVLAVYMPEKLPVGCDEKNMAQLIDWWARRAIPDSSRGIQQTLRKLNENTNLTLMLNSYGLSLIDHYWLQLQNWSSYRHIS